MQSQSTAKAASALSLRWTVGMNVSLPSMVHSLSVPHPNASSQSPSCPFSLSAADYSSNIVYATSHTAVSHDLSRDAQFLLQGHCNAISSVCVSSDKKTVVTADAAQDLSSSGDCVIVLWDPSRGVPVKSFSSRVPPGGIRSMDLSPDARLLVTVSNGSPQVVQIWDLSAPSEDEAVLAQHALEADFEHQHFVRFNPIDIHDIVTNGATRSVFWSWTAGELTPLHPPHAVTKLRAKIGAMTQSAYLPHTSRVISGTLSGEIVVWDYPHAGATCRHPVKIIKLSGRSCGLNLIEVVNKYVVAASTDGAVRFYDFQFRVLGWLEDLHAGEITSISFAQYTPEASVIASATAGNGLSNPSAAAAATDELLHVPPFIVSTTAGKVILCDSLMMNHVDPEVRKGRLLLSGLDGDCNALSAHPSQPYFAVGTSNGTVSIWNLEQHVAQRTRGFDRGVTCVQYSPNGQMLAVGLEHGAIVLLKTVFDATESNSGTATTIEEIQTLSHGSSAITHITFAADNEHIAFADASRHVGLFRYFHVDEDSHRDKEWIYVGRSKAHTKAITSLFFNGQGVVCFDPELCDEPSKHTPSEEKPIPSGNSISAKDKNDQRASKRAELIRGAEQWEGNRLRLYSFGRDGRLNEFDVGESWIRTGLCLKRSVRLDQTGQTTDALPLYLLNAIDLALPRGADPSDPLIPRQYSLVPYWITSGSDHKLRAWREDLGALEEDGAGNLMCVKTSAAPTYGGPVSKMLLLPTQKGADTNNQYLFYTTAGKVVGLLKLPLDGHPSKSMALIAHATPVTAITNSHDGKFVITGGGADRCINVWAVAPQEFESAIESAAVECGSFEDMLEGGKGGELYNEIVDYFVYAQLRSQSKGHREAHNLSGCISAQDAVNLLRSLHCYPTQTEIQHLVHELAFEEKDDSAGGNAISLSKFIQLFFNHRPAVGVRKSEFEAVFRLLKDREASEVESFKDGEAPLLHGVSRDKLVELLQTHGEPMSQAEVAFCFDTLLGTTGQTEVSEEELEQELLPSQLTPDHFAARVLGFGAASQ